MAQYAGTILIAAAVVVFIIYQQLRTRPVTARQLILPPAFLAFLGITNLSHHAPASSAGDIALGLSVLVALLFGFARGIATRVWWVEGIAVRKGSTITVLLWIVGIALRLAIAVVARREGVPTSVSTGEIPLFLGITLAAQNAVIWMRAQGAPLPSHTSVS
jgi:membrane protein CcdC involved in cytochrome C biogenesis